MPQTLAQILLDVNSYVDLSAAMPTGDELTTRSNYANQVIRDVSDMGQLPEFDQVYEVDPGSASSVLLPAGFREFKINPQQLVNGAWTEYPEIAPQERYQKGAGEKYCYLLGNPASGFTAHFNNLEASCTLSFTYQAFPTGFPTLTSVCELRDSSYVVTAVESYVLQARGSDKFPYVDSIRANKLKNLFGRSMKSAGGQYRVAPTRFVNPLR